MGFYGPIRVIDARGFEVPAGQVFKLLIKARSLIPADASARLDGKADSSVVAPKGKRMAQFIKVDYRNFEDAVEISDQRGGRIRMSDASKAHAYLARKGVDHGALVSKGMSKPNSAMTILSEGLMEGIYVSWPDSRESWLYVDVETDIEPLRIYEEDEMEFDLVVSYAFDDYEKSIVQSLSKELGRFGLRVFLIGDRAKPDDPIWKIRFREAVFHSYYFVPFLSRNYLKGQGSIVELFDVARETVHHRATEFFYPLLPLVEDWESLRTDSLSQRSKTAYEFDKDGFEWVRSHIFPLNLKWGIPKIARFLNSLVNNYRGARDYDFLREVSDLLEFVELMEIGGTRKARVYLRRPHAGSFHQFLLSDRSCQFVGFFETGERARQTDGTPRTVDEIEAFLDGELRGEEHAATSPERPTPPQFEGDSGTWLCVNCRYGGEPNVKTVPPNPSIGLHEAISLFRCPVCGGTMVKH